MQGFSTWIPFFLYEETLPLIAISDSKYTNILQFSCVTKQLCDTK